MNNHSKKFTDSFSVLGVSLILLFLSSFFWMPDTGFFGDIGCWKNWACAILDGGIGKAYQHPDINYHPLFLYVLKGYAILFGDQYGIYTHINILKCFVFLFDISAVALIAFYLKKLKLNPLLSLFILFNPAFWYDTILWGQIDTIHTFFCFAAIILILENKPIVGALIWVLALLVKLQAIIFVPLLAILLIPVYLEKPNVLIKSIIGGLMLILLFISPFIMNGEIHNLWRVVTGAVGSYPYISLHAYNFWHIIFPGKDLMWVSDQTNYFFMSLKNYGLLLYILALLFSLYPIGSFILKNKKSVAAFSLSKEFISMLFLSTGLICLDFFFFNTQMHERYVHPAILFFGIAAILSRKYIPFIIISIAYFLNLDGLIQQMKFSDAVYHFPGLYQPLTIAICFALVFIMGHYQLYKTVYTLNLENNKLS